MQLGGNGAEGIFEWVVLLISRVIRPHVHLVHTIIRAINAEIY
jgi:phage-related protein